MKKQIRPRIDLTGHRSGKLLIKGFSHRKVTNRCHQYFWNCICDCGNEKAIRRDALVEKRVISCGCIQINTYEYMKTYLQALPVTMEGCKLWNKWIEKNGYGRINVERKKWSTHRLSYHLFKGPIPSDMFVCHKCDNPKCVNPDHLWLGTSEDNMKDMVKKDRQMQHENHYRAKLSKMDVIEIRKQHANLMNELATRYQISRGNLVSIISKKSWKGI